MPQKPCLNGSKGDPLKGIFGPKNVIFPIFPILTSVEGPWDRNIWGHTLSRFFFIFSLACGGLHCFDAFGVIFFGPGFCSAVTLIGGHKNAQNLKKSPVL